MIYTMVVDNFASLEGKKTFWMTRAVAWIIMEKFGGTLVGTIILGVDE